MSKEQNQLERATRDVNVERAAEVEQQHYATVLEQIDEELMGIAEDNAAIDACLDAIRVRRTSIRTHRARVAYLRRQKRIFARASFELRQLKEDRG